MAELDTNVNTEVETEETTETGVETVETEKDTNAELAKLRADFAKQKAALDKATKEAGEAQKALRAKQTAEEAAAEEAKAQQEALMNELERLRKERAVSSITAKAVSLVGSESAGQLAEDLYGAADVDAAIAAIQKAWTAKEKALRLEYGKIPAPGTGSADGPTMTKAQLDAMKYQDRVKYKQMHPEEYNKLMGR